MIEARQIRAARALLGWSQADLARAAGMATSSIKNLESANGSARRETFTLIRDTLEAAGVEFTPALGVRFKSDIVAVHEGRNATPALLESIYATVAASPEREVCVIGLDEGTLAELDGASTLSRHAERLKREEVRQRVLICEGVRQVFGDPESYRWLPRDYFARNSPIYIYGDRIAIQTGSLKRRTIIIESGQAARNLKNVFALLWDKAAVAPARLDPALP